MSTYYIDWENGDDRNNGTSTSAPFKHAPRDDNASGKVPSSLLAGDTVVFKGGVTYRGRKTSLTFSGKSIVYTSDDGVEGRPITFISGHVHSSLWGSGRAVIDGSSDSGGTYRRGFYFLNAAWIVCEGFEVHHIGTRESPVSGCQGITWDQSMANHGICRNNVVHDINWFTEITDSFATGHGIVTSRGSNWLCEDNVVYNCSDKLIALFGGAQDPNPHAGNAVVRHNIVHDSSAHGITLSVDNAQVYGNIIYNTATAAVTGSPAGGMALKVGFGSGNKIFNNIFHTVFGALGVVGGGRNNEFHHNTVWGVGTEGGSSLTRQRSMILLGHDGTGSWSSPEVTGNKFFNNSFHYLGGPSGDDENRSNFISTTPLDGGGDKNEVKNNIFYGERGDTTDTRKRTVTYSKVNWTGARTFRTLAEWEQSFVARFNGVAFGNIVVDQIHRGGLLETLTGAPTEFLSDGLTPTPDGLDLDPGSPNRGKGIVLASPFDFDVLGLNRRFPSPGAYEIDTSKAVFYRRRWR